MDNHIKKLVEKYPNDFELGKYVRRLYWLQQENYFKENDIPISKSATSDNRPWIYESPDGGKTVTRRRRGADISTKEKIDVKKLTQTVTVKAGGDGYWTCTICGHDTSEVEYDYIGSGTNHLSCELKLEDTEVLNKQLKLFDE
jgi:hypothetical protein